MVWILATSSSAPISRPLAVRAQGRAREGEEGGGRWEGVRWDVGCFCFCMSVRSLLTALRAFALRDVFLAGKLIGVDKKLSRSLEEDVKGSSSPLELSSSPVGPLHEASSRRTLVYLILTLNQVYPDYDFSLVRAQHFVKESDASAVRADADARLLPAARAWEDAPGGEREPFSDALWTAIDEAVGGLAECDVYRYRASDDEGGDPFAEQGSVWSFNVFFYSRRLKRILYFACRGVARSAADDDEPSTTSGARYNTDSARSDGAVVRGRHSDDEDSDDDGDDAATSFAKGMDL